jgi:succinyl-diaminopimelate desuccinylase
MSTDPVELTAALVRCPSVTPEEGGALQLLEKHAERGRLRLHPGRPQRHAEPLRALGERNARRVLGFNGHTDVVPVGDPADWTHPPFSAHREDGWLYGRGATDMKSGVAAFVAAAVDLVDRGTARRRDRHRDHRGRGRTRTRRHHRHSRLDGGNR